MRLQHPRFGNYLCTLTATTTYMGTYRHEISLSRYTCLIIHFLAVPLVGLQLFTTKQFKALYFLHSVVVVNSHWNATLHKKLYQKCASSMLAVKTAGAAGGASNCHSEHLKVSFSAEHLKVETIPTFLSGTCLLASFFSPSFPQASFRYDSTDCIERW